jgi:hypothetical protein
MRPNLDKNYELALELTYKLAEHGYNIDIEFLPPVGNNIKCCINAFGYPMMCGLHELKEFANHPLKLVRTAFLTAFKDQGINYGKGEARVLYDPNNENIFIISIGLMKFKFTWHNADAAYYPTSITHEKYEKGVQLVGLPAAYAFRSPLQLRNFMLLCMQQKLIGMIYNSKLASPLSWADAMVRASEVVKRCLAHIFKA